MYKRLLLILLSMTAVSVSAQNENAHSFSIFTGGFLLKNSTLSTTKFGYEKNHLGALADFTYDDYRETWQDGSKSFFRIAAISAGARYYLKPLGRSVFAEGSLGVGKANLTTKENSQRKKRSSTIPFSGFGLGWRFGKKPTGIFGEIAYRFNFYLKESHLYTTDNKPDTENTDNISYQSWYFEKGNGSGQLYVGIGYSF